MKNIKTLLAFFTLITLSVSITVNAQDRIPEEVKKMIESQNYIFIAQSVSPMGGRTRQLTPENDLTITKDTIVSFLPYFGRAYSAPINTGEGGIKFTSTNFAYKYEKGRKSWKITINLKDVPDTRQLYLEIFDNTNASLQVTSTNRESISFNGYIKEGREKDKKGF